MTDEIGTNDECLGKAVRNRLDRKLEVEPILRSVAKEAVEARGILGRGDDEDVLNPCQHQR